MGAASLARKLGVSPLLIGLTVVALGTSLPELAASVASNLKGEDDIAVGNVIGSNIFNLLAVLCLPGLLAPSAIHESVLMRDFPVMLGLTIGLYVLGRGRKGNGRISRLEGSFLLTCFVAYQGWLYLEAQPRLMGA